ncbi:MAG: DUF3426 domain-containing protein [Steroidobacteraceae bacterium]|nr:DUF3426 domain-containing protein [Nevskiaceae bacterium]
MITICPQCQLPLTVTAANLRIAQGQVRCGRCAAVFNALASLFEPGGQHTTTLHPTSLPPTAEESDDESAAQDPASMAADPDPGDLPDTDTPASPGPTALPADVKTLHTGSSLFRSPPRDDEPRFDDTHGADDWPDDIEDEAEDRDAATSGSAAAVQSPAEITDTFRREPGSGVAPDRPAPMSASAPASTPILAPALAPVPAARPRPASDAVTGIAASAELSPPRPPAREPTTDSLQRPAAPQQAVTLGGAGGDWQIDTMMAAELAALVVRAQRDEPPELASIRIAVDDASEITVLPSESPSPLPRPAAKITDDDPGIAAARQATVEHRTAAQGSGSTLRWLELEPAPPSSIPLPGRPVAAPAAATPQLESPPPVVASRVPIDDVADTDAVNASDAVVADLAAGGAARAAQAPRWMWIATVLLGLALALQLAHLYREELASVPSLQAPLTQLYAALGRPLQSRWELARYELRQQGVVAEPSAAGTLTVRASIRNAAARAQPAPLLRVTLQDRFGNRLATRDLTPREYAGAAAIAPVPMLAPGQRIDAEVSLLDPGGEAVGFELDVCLRRSDSSVTCANDRAGAIG